MSTKDDNRVNLEINGEPAQARPGQMIIEVTDEVGAYVPRFCYHRKLSIAANCRMCLVDVEKAPKPLPACATPVAEGMKVFTRSARALSAQKATMEFLLINHPLDCPICDQGGECELQDLAMGFGRGVSRYTERKRVVRDKNLGSLVSTDMTRCIHCTRCVRYGEEIAGLEILGAVGRGENMEISSYVERSIDHEMSANIIDLCPVGALNNKPFRFNARSWEMAAKPLVSPHDCAGSNLYAHVLRGRVRRVVPRENDAINETWLADRDRFSCHALDAEDRLEQPMIKRDGQWHAVAWDEALEHVAAALKAAGSEDGRNLGFLSAPAATLEEQFLLRLLADHFECRNIDHRVRRTDFDDEANDPIVPSLGSSIAGLDTVAGVLLVGCDIRSEAPILAHRLRTAVTRHGGAVAGVNIQRYEYRFATAAQVVSSPAELAGALAGVLAAAGEATGVSLPANVAAAAAGAVVTDTHRAAAAVLGGDSERLLLLGQIAQRHPAYSTLRALAAALCAVTGARLGFVTEGGNAAGAAIAGVLPHREPGGAASETAGMHAQAMLQSPRRAYVVYGLEPDGDFADTVLAGNALAAADTVVAFSSFAGEALKSCATVLLPTAAFTETPGTYVNGEGVWQSVDAAAQAPGEARPGWRILRVLGNILGIGGFEYQSCEEVRAELTARIGDLPVSSEYGGAYEADAAPVEVDVAALVTGIYAVDAVVRRSQPLQQTALAGGAPGGTATLSKSA